MHLSENMESFFMMQIPFPQNCFHPNHKYLRESIFDKRYGISGAYGAKMYLMDTAAPVDVMQDPGLLQ